VVLSCLLFGLAHVFGFSDGALSFDVLPIDLTAIHAFLAVWLRLRTGSFFFPTATKSRQLQHDRNLKSVTTPEDCIVGRSRYPPPQTGRILNASFADLACRLPRRARWGGTRFPAGGEDRL
jgi:hypothetical protein